MGVDPEHEVPRGKEGLQDPQPGLAQVAEARVVAAALGVVVVGDDRHGEAEGGEQVESVKPPADWSVSTADTSWT